MVSNGCGEKTTPTSAVEEIACIAIPVMDAPAKDVVSTSVIGEPRVYDTGVTVCVEAYDGVLVREKHGVVEATGVLHLVLAGDKDPCLDALVHAEADCEGDARSVAGPVTTVPVSDNETVGEADIERSAELGAESLRASDMVGVCDAHSDDDEERQDVMV